MDLPGGVKADFSECGFIAGPPSTCRPATRRGRRHQSRHIPAEQHGGRGERSQGAKCDLTAGHTLFAGPAPSEPGMMTELDRKAVVMRSTDTPDSNTFTIPDGAPSAVYLVDPPAGGATPTVLSATPWATAPKFDAENPFTVLELNAKLPLLRVGDAKRDVLGVRHWNDRRAILHPVPAGPSGAGERGGLVPKDDNRGEAEPP